MPQLDKISFFNQLFWFLFIFSGFYAILLKNFLPKRISVLKARSKKVLKNNFLASKLKSEKLLFLGSSKKTFLLAAVLCSISLLSKHET
jgi:F0F1-type ATP synthase membrane subunit b/b'